MADGVHSVDNFADFGRIQGVVGRGGEQSRLRADCKRIVDIPELDPGGTRQCATDPSGYSSGVTPLQPQALAEKPGQRAPEEAAGRRASQRRSTAQSCRQSRALG